MPEYHLLNLHIIVHAEVPIVISGWGHQYRVCLVSDYHDIPVFAVKLCL